MSGDDDEWAVDAEEFDDSGDEPGDDEWRFSLEDLEDDEGPGSNGHEAEEDEDVGGNVFGTLQSDSEEIEPGSPSLENTAFVLLGIVLALLLFAQFLLVLIGGA